MTCTNYGNPIKIVTMDDMQISDHFLVQVTTSLARSQAIYTVVFTQPDQDQLQDLYWLAAWEKGCDMVFHPGKCTTLPVTRIRRGLHSDYKYKLYGHTLQTVDSQHLL